MKIVITQPYLPAYRVPLFEALHARATSRGHELKVVTGEASGAQALRGDQASAAWHQTVTARKLNLLGRGISLRSLRSIPEADVLVTELDPGNLLAWHLLTKRSSKWIAWGHGMSYTTRSLPASNQIRFLMARHADRVMTYTERGRQFLIKNGGAAADKVVAIGNSTDTKKLLDAKIPISASSVRPHALFVGALDPSKRIGFLLDAALHAREINPAFVLTIIGRGALEPEVQAFTRANPWTKWVPDARGAQLAQAAATASAIWMPGRVGLVAVDALALGLPVHTTHFEFHAPEIDYLQDGVSLAYLSDSPSLYASESLSRIPALPRFTSEDVPSIDGVADRFWATIDSLIVETQS